MQRACRNLPGVAGLCVAVALSWPFTAALADDATTSWVPATPVAQPTSTSDAHAIEDRTYSLTELLTLALSINPQTRAAEEKAYQASLATRLVKSQYAPQVDIKALG